MDKHYIINICEIHSINDINVISTHPEWFSTNIVTGNQDSVLINGMRYIFPTSPKNLTDDGIQIYNNLEQFSFKGKIIRKHETKYNTRYQQYILDYCQMFDVWRNFNLDEYHNIIAKILQNLIFSIRIGNEPKWIKNIISPITIFFTETYVLKNDEIEIYKNKNLIKECKYYISD